MIRKVAKPWNEVQLGFTFFAEEEVSSPVVRERESHKGQKLRETKTTPANLCDALTLTQTQLLEAPIDEVSSQLLPLFGILRSRTDACS